ncbi:TPA: DUF3944 domain-containing protein [Raoultella planticola]
MAIYRNDPDLNLLGKCSNEELQLLVSILTTDPRDGDTRWTESLTSTPEYRLLAPDHRRYWQLTVLSLPHSRCPGRLRFYRHSGHTAAWVKMHSSRHLSLTPVDYVILKRNRL